MIFKNAKVLIVGGAGFVGSNLSRALLKLPVKSVSVVDNLLSSELSNLPKDDRLFFIRGSIAEDKIFKKIDENTDYVFHLATFHGNQSSIFDPLADHQNNTLTTLKICEFFKDKDNLKKIVYSSAGCTVAKKIYGTVDASDEQSEISLYHDSPYQISKIIGELYGNYYFSRYKLPFVKARFQNVYGPGEILGAGQWRGTSATVWRNVIPTFVWRSLRGESLPLENQGLASRDFIFVDDITRGLIACAKNGEPGEVYNLASGVETSIKDIAKIINKFTQNKAPLELKGKRSWDRSGNRFGATHKAEKEIQFKSKVLLEEGLKITIEWFKSNEKLIRDNMLKHKSQMPELKRYQ